MNRNMFTSRRKMSLLSFRILTVLIVLLMAAATTSADDRGGPAFSDPALKTEMPAEWDHQPIAHKPDFGQVDVVFDLNQQLYPTLQPIITQYAEEHGFTVMILNGTCGKSAGQLERKEIEIGSACCPPGLLDRLPGLRFHTLGIIPLTFLVHPTNPVSNVSLSTLRDIFQGKIADWSKVGGPQRKTKLIASIHCKKKPGDWRPFLANEDLFSPDVLETGEMEDMIAFVANNPDAIGYETPNVAERFKNRGEVKLLHIDGYDPMNLDNTITGKYPLYRTYLLTTWETPGAANPHASELVDFLMKKIQGIDSIPGFIPSATLRQAGWKFEGNELIGTPN